MGTGLLRPPERVPEVPVGKNSRRWRRISRGGALHRKGERNSRVVPQFQESPRERIPGVGVASQEEVFSTGKARGTPGSCHNSKSPPGKEFPAFPSHLKRRRSPQERREELQGRATIPRVPQMCRLQKYPKIHVSTGEESSGSGPDSTQGLRPRHRRERNPERPPRNSHGVWPFLRPPERVPDVPVGKNSRRSRRISRGGALHRKGERNSRVVPPFQESPRCVSPFQRNLFSLHYLDVQAEDRLPRRVHVGQPCGKASWESLVGKSRGKTIDPLIHAAYSVTLLLPLRRKAQVHARIRYED
ncbi:hypothetical protein MJT46_009408 [Ovis ammon polii x Ovis aries]|nr:hypothetical protein MJT46_009408 [Ovis ammon polii x Ovis aries]